MPKISEAVTGQLNSLLQMRQKLTQMLVYSFSLLKYLHKHDQ